MTPSARLAAAIDVLTAIDERHKPARLALKEWGERARYAGSGDRAWVSGLVLDALRKRRSLAARMGEEAPRVLALAGLHFAWGWSTEDIAAAAAGQPHGPGALSVAEAAALSKDAAPEARPPPVSGDYPDWLEEPFARVFGEARAEEGRALARRAPVDLRVNTLKADREKVLRALEPMGAHTSPWLMNALRIEAPEAHRRAAAVESHPTFEKGWFEVQDQGSQIAAAAAGQVAHKQVLDFCAGGGGKTLALAAAMGNSGQLYAYDIDQKRLSEAVRRARRAGVRNLQVRPPSGPEPLKGLEGRMDVVFVDAPCTGTGTWRRHPDAKWRLTPAALERRMAEQDALLATAPAYLKPGGRLVYVTCSVLMEENEDRLADLSGLRVVPVLEALTASELATPEGLDHLRPHMTSGGQLRLTPARTQTDGFFVAVLEKA
ncbi:MAG TPA: RsmB/NOP family class I SAM-dependent RNA methyltransferase [Caulobacteraceae bacterium]